MIPRWSWGLEPGGHQKTSDVAGSSSEHFPVKDAFYFSKVAGVGPSLKVMGTIPRRPRSTWGRPLIIGLSAKTVWGNVSCAEIVFAQAKETRRKWFRGSMMKSRKTGCK